MRLGMPCKPSSLGILNIQLWLWCSISCPSWVWGGSLHLGYIWADSSDATVLSFLNDCELALYQIVTCASLTKVYFPIETERGRHRVFPTALIHSMFFKEQASNYTTLDNFPHPSALFTPCLPSLAVCTCSFPGRKQALWWGYPFRSMRPTAFVYESLISFSWRLEMARSSCP